LTEVATKRELANNWKSRHLGNVFLNRSSAGWVVTLLHSDGVRGLGQYLVPFKALRPRRQRALAACLKLEIKNTLTQLDGGRELSGHEASRWILRPNASATGRYGLTRMPLPGNWNETGRLRPKRGISGVSYFVIRSERGWLVMLRSLSGSPCGSFLIPFGNGLPRRGRWDADFLLTPVRRFISGLEGAREIGYSEWERLSGWCNELVGGEAAA
jgi:hypothetical protein